MDASRTKKYIYDVGALDQRSSAPSQILALVGANKRVLEVGCASGAQTRVLKERLNCTVTGIEIDPQAAGMARPYCDRLIVGSIEQLDLAEVLAGQAYDVIMFADVLEHLRDPAHALGKVAPLLAAHGFVLASIPNVAHVSVVVELIKGNFEYRPFGLLDDTHIRFFTRKSIIDLFEQAGYRIIKLDRAVAPNHDTDGQPAPSSPERQALAELVRRHNPESDTFQFIVAAGRAIDGGQGSWHDAQTARSDPGRSESGRHVHGESDSMAPAHGRSTGDGPVHRAMDILRKLKRSMLG